MCLSEKVQKSNICKSKIGSLATFLNVLIYLQSLLVKLKIEELSQKYYLTKNKCIKRPCIKMENVFFIF